MRRMVSDIEDFTATPPSSSPAISEFSQSQSILSGAQIDVQNSQIAEQTSHGSVDRVVIQTSDVHSVTDVDSMDPSLASLKRRSRRPRNNSPGTKHRRVVSASPPWSWAFRLSPWSWAACWFAISGKRSPILVRSSCVFIIFVGFPHLLIRNGVLSDS